MRRPIYVRSCVLPSAFNTSESSQALFALGEMKSRFSRSVQCFITN